MRREGKRKETGERKREDSNERRQRLRKKEKHNRAMRTRGKGVTV